MGMEESTSTLVKVVREVFVVQLRRVAGRIGCTVVILRVVAIGKRSSSCLHSAAVVDGEHVQMMGAQRLGDRRGVGHEGRRGSDKSSFGQTQVGGAERGREERVVWPVVVLIAHGGDFMRSMPAVRMAPLQLYTPSVPRRLDPQAEMTIT